MAEWEGATCGLCNRVHQVVNGKLIEHDHRDGAGSCSGGGFTPKDSRIIRELITPKD